MVIKGDAFRWSSLIARIGTVVDIERSARDSGALKRRRQVRSGADLLRLALAYGPGGQSLRETAAWAEVQEVSSLSDVAVLKRLRHSAEWLAGLAGSVLAQQVAAPASGGQARPDLPRLDGLRLRVVDGSRITPPGQKGGFRLHAVFDVAEQRFSQLDLTDSRGAERLERVAAGPGDLIVADRGYPRAGGLHHLVEAGADFLIRIGQRSVAFRPVDAGAFDLAAALDEADRIGVVDRPVLIVDKRRRSPRPPLPTRLVILPKPPEAAGRARQKAAWISRHNSHRAEPLSLRAAGYLMILTTLSSERASPGQLAALYRLRWQIELAFKRLKSLLHIDRLPAKDEALARTWILAHLMVALLIQDLTPAEPAFPP